MIDLKLNDYCTAKISNDGKIVEFENMPEVTPGTRTVSDMSAVLIDQHLDERVLYYMYRGLAEIEDIRFDITTIPAGFVGDEYVKTYGHIHKANEFGLTYPEVYNVLAGEATFVLQKVDGNKVADIILVKAKEGESIIIPPGYGHHTVNTGSGLLVLSNLIYSKCESDYSTYTDMMGACVFLTNDGIIDNSVYLRFTEVQEVNAIPTEGFFDDLDFLIKPEFYRTLFRKYLDTLLGNTISL